MSDNVVQQGSNSSVVGTVAVTLTGVVAGNTLVAFAFDGSTTTPATHAVSDAQGSYTAQGAAATDATNFVWGQVFTLTNANSGSHTVTGNFGGGSDICFLMVVEVGSTAGASAFSGSNAAFQTSPGTATDALSSGSATVTGASTLVGFSTDSASLTPSDEPTIGTGFTTRANNTSTAMGAWRLESKAASADAAATFTAPTGTHNFITLAVAILNSPGALNQPPADGWNWDSVEEDASYDESALIESTANTQQADVFPPPVPPPEDPDSLWNDGYEDTILDLIDFSPMQANVPPVDAPFQDVFQSHFDEPDLDELVIDDYANEERDDPLGVDAWPWDDDPVDEWPHGLDAVVCADAAVAPPLPEDAWLWDDSLDGDEWTSVGDDDDDAVGDNEPPLPAETAWLWDDQVEDEPALDAQLSGDPVGASQPPEDAWSFDDSADGDEWVTAGDDDDDAVGPDAPPAAIEDAWLWFDPDEGDEQSLLHLDFAPVGADFVSLLPLVAEDAWPHDDHEGDPWIDTLDTLPVGADVINALPEDAWPWDDALDGDDWAAGQDDDDAVGLDAPALPEDLWLFDEPVDDDWAGDSAITPDAAAADQPVDDLWIWDEFDAEALPLDEAVGADAPAAAMPPEDAFDWFGSEAIEESWPEDGGLADGLVPPSQFTDDGWDWTDHEFAEWPHEDVLGDDAIQLPGLPPEDAWPWDDTVEDEPQAFEAQVGPNFVKPQNILARRQLRLAAVAVLSAITGVTVESPGDWAIKPSRLPNIKLRVVNERKVSVARTMPEFTTTATLQIIATIQALTEQDAQDQIDALGQLIEAAFFCAQPLVRMCQQFSGVNTQVEITAEGEQHVAQMLMAVDCEMFESFDPTEINPADYPALLQLNVHLDTMVPFDATGTYASPPFPASVTPAPRIAGPDGRDEAALQINLPSP